MLVWYQYTNVGAHNSGAYIICLIRATSGLVAFANPGSLPYDDGSHHLTCTASGMIVEYTVPPAVQVKWLCNVTQKHPYLGPVWFHARAWQSAMKGHEAFVLSKDSLHGMRHGPNSLCNNVQLICFSPMIPSFYQAIQTVIGPMHRYSVSMKTA